jgi:hypothetical protein
MWMILPVGAACRTLQIDGEACGLLCCVRADKGELSRRHPQRDVAEVHHIADSPAHGQHTAATEAGM